MSDLREKLKRLSPSGATPVMLNSNCEAAELREGQFIDIWCEDTDFTWQKAVVESVHGRWSLWYRLVDSGKRHHFTMEDDYETHGIDYELWEGKGRYATPRRRLAVKAYNRFTDGGLFRQRPAERRKLSEKALEQQGFRPFAMWMLKLRVLNLLGEDGEEHRLDPMLNLRNPLSWLLLLLFSLLYPLVEGLGNISWKDYRRQAGLMPRYYPRNIVLWRP